jgi:hypothetical protein
MNVIATYARIEHRAIEKVDVKNLFFITTSTIFSPI